jgi:hypothetical protein
MAPKNKGKGKATPTAPAGASPEEDRLTEAERLAKIDAMKEKKKATAAKAAATKARNKKAKEDAAVRALAVPQGGDEEPLPSIEGNAARPVRAPSAAGPSRHGRSPSRPGRSDSEVDPRRHLLATPSRGPRHYTPSEVITASPSKILRKKAKLNLFIGLLALCLNPHSRRVCCPSAYWLPLVIGLKE